jgi:hypothetical protein
MFYFTIEFNFSASHPISSKMPPKELSGIVHGITIESLDGEEGAATVELKALLSIQQQVLNH